MQVIGFANYKKLQKFLMRQYRMFALVNYRSVIMKLLVKKTEFTMKEKKIL